MCTRAIEKYSPFQAGLKTNWHKKMQTTLDLLVSQVLNNQSIVKKCYHTMDVPKVLMTIGFMRRNILFIGRKSSWIINARAEKQYNLVGTQINYGFDSKICNY